MAYASDVSAPTAAWVAEKLGLPTNPYDTVKLMTRKDLFHPFLKENGFIGVPRFVLLDKNGCIMWRNAKRPSDADLQKELDLLFK